MVPPMKPLPLLLIASLPLPAAPVLGQLPEASDSDAAASTYPLALPQAMEGDLPIRRQPDPRDGRRIDLLPDVWFSNFVPRYAPQS